MDLPVFDLGRMAYPRALAAQREHHAAVLAGRGSADPAAGRLLLVEHDPVVTLTKRPGVAGHLLVSPARLAALGIAVEETDRGGDITYHGPGQVVVYPIVDLNALGLRIHGYMRALESAVIATLAGFGLGAGPEGGATGVWVPRPPPAPAAKICAMGVRVRRWVTLHGLALNVTTDLAHFATIVPCGLAGREVTSMARELGARCPPVERVKADLVAALRSGLLAGAPPGRGPAPADAQPPSPSSSPPAGSTPAPGTPSPGRPSGRAAGTSAGTS